MPSHDPDHVAERPELGGYLRDARPLIDAVKWLMVRDYEILHPTEALPDPERVTVYLANHGPMFAPLPAPVLTTDFILNQGGYDDLRAVTLFSKLIKFLPGMTTILTHYFGNSTDELQSLSGLIEMMKARAFHVIGTAPEGASCLWTYDDAVGPFTKPGLIIAALESDADIVLTAQKGVEVYGKRIRFPLGLRLPLFDGPDGMQLPFWRPGLRAHVILDHHRYRPLMSADERAALSDADRRVQLGEEIARVREQLLELYEGISVR